MELEVIQAYLCAVGYSPKIDIGRLHEFISLMLFIIQLRDNAIYSYIKQTNIVAFFRSTYW
jgi:hypothetical protein